MNGIAGTRPKWPSSVVVAVPVCRPARPARAHPSLGVAGEEWKHNVCIWKSIIRGWKRRCADVRAGTQAPPLPFQTRASKLRARNQKVFCSQKRCERQTVRECICRNAASTKPFGNSFAGTLRASNRSGMHLQKCCKRQTVRECICRNAASAKPFGNSFAGTLRAFEKVE